MLFARCQGSRAVHGFLAAGRSAPLTRGIGWDTWLMHLAAKKDSTHAIQNRRGQGIFPLKAL